nr:WRKY6532 [Atractylodes chinensis]
MAETASPNKKRLIGELIRGRDSTKKLQNLLRRHDGSVSAQDLVMQILGSFSDSLSVLSFSDSCPLSATTFLGSPCSDDRTLDSAKTEKKPVKDRRGCYKRRKTEDSRVKIVYTIEDGYAWRKYGQKEILNAKFPRCYFRCTHKNEGCKALKQVQKLEDGSEMFHITYFGHHICQNEHKNTHMFSDSGDLSSFLLNFEDTKSNHSPSSPSTITNAHNTPSLEQEDDSNAQSNELIASSKHSQSSMALWKDIIGNFDSSHEDIFNNSASMGGGFKFDENVFF